jgi:Tol biopolymer transport system component
VIDGESMTIKRFDLAGGTATALTDRTQVLTGMPSVSPDGKTVAFAGQKNTGQRYDQEENTVWLVDAGGARTLEAEPLQGRAPVWSPDGKKIAFESDRGNGQAHYALFMANRDGSGLVQLTDFALDATHPVFSRDGRHMVFSHGGGISGVAVIDLP